MGNTAPTSVDKSAPSYSDFSKYEGEGPFWTSDGTTESTIRFADKGVASKEELPPQTVVELFQKACKKRGDKLALRVERSKLQSLADYKKSGGKNWPKPLNPADWDTWTYNEYYEQCTKVAKSLMSMGLEQHDAVTIFGFNSPEWVMSEVGAIIAGGKAAGIYPTDTVEQVTFKVKHSGSSVACVESAKKMAAIKENADELPKLKAVVVWGEEVSAEDITRTDGSKIAVLSWKAFLEKGADVSDEDLEKRIAQIKPGHCCALIYTSGTTGQPKAVMISHDNIIFESSQITKPGMLGTMGQADEEERIMSYLPLSHVAGMMVDIIAPLVVSSYTAGWVTVSFARVYDLKIGSLGDRLRDIKPTMFLGVPRVWEKIQEKMVAAGSKSKGCKASIIKWGKSKGLERAMALQIGGDGHLPNGYGTANGMVLSKVKKLLGLQHCKVGLTGAAPIRKATLEFYGSLGIQINEVYGMSECCGATTWSTQNHHLWGSCGYGMDGTELAIFKCDPEDINKKTRVQPTKDIFNAPEEEQGEICYRGRHIMMGYMANPELGEEHVNTINKKNADAIDSEGWLHSGDKGCIGENGMVKITGRYKELIIGAGGENIAPVPIESAIKVNCPVISNVMMFGDKMKYNTCVVTLKTEGATGEEPGTDKLALQAAALSNSKTISEASADPTFIETISDAIFKVVNASAVNNASKVQKFTILPSDFSVNTGELTPTFKLKRSVVAKKYEEAIGKMYESKERYVPFTAEIAEAYAKNLEALKSAEKKEEEPKQEEEKKEEEPKQEEEKKEEEPKQEEEKKEEEPKQEEEKKEEEPKQE